MFSQLFSLTRPLIVFDLETTGTADGSRIVEMGHQVYLPGGEVREWRSLIDPEVPIPRETTLVHHITNGRIRSCRKCAFSASAHAPGMERIYGPGVCEEFRPWPKFINLAQNLAKGYSNCDFAGKNVRFDLGILAGEFRRVRVPWSYAGAAIVDADRLEALLEPRDLSSLYRRRLGKEPINAHSALDDVRMTAEILLDQLVKGEALPRSLGELHELQWPGFVDAEGKIRRGKDGVARLQFGKHRGEDVRKVDSSYWQWVAKSDFSEEFKGYAARYARGEF